MSKKIKIMIDLYRQILNEFPEDFQLMLKALGHKTRVKIGILLLNKKSLSLLKIIDSLKIEKTLLLNHIKILELGGLVQNYLKRTESTREYSFYELTRFGRNIVTGLISNYIESYSNSKDDEMSQALKYIDDFPEDFELSLKGISNKSRFSLIAAMSGLEEMSFTEIRKMLNLEKNTVTSHLKKLELGGLVQNYFKKKEDSREYSFYTITTRGKSIISKLIQEYNEFYKDLRDSKGKSLRDALVLTESPSKRVFLNKDSQTSE